MSAPALLGLGTAVPERTITQAEALEILRGRCFPTLGERARGVAEKVFGHPSVRTRHLAVDDPRALIGEDPDRRMERFSRRAVTLAAAAAREALEKSGRSAADVAAVVVNTCTGYVCPGISSYLMEELGLRRNLPAFDLVGAGCAGALANLMTCRSLAASSGGTVLGVAVEICSATFQMGEDPGLIVSNALFGDGAAAMVVGEGEGWHIAGCRSLHAPEHREHIRFVYRNGQLHNRLTNRVPVLVARTVRQLVEEFFAEHRLTKEAIAHWSLHGGGENVIAAVQEELGLSDDAIAGTRRVLERYGNMSSPSVLFTFREVMEGRTAPGDRALLVAFGAGLTAHAVLLQNNRGQRSEVREQ